MGTSDLKLRAGLIVPKDNRLFASLKPVGIVSAHMAQSGHGYVVPGIDTMRHWRVSSNGSPRQFDVLVTVGGQPAPGTSENTPLAQYIAQYPGIVGRKGTKSGQFLSVCVGLCPLWIKTYIRLGPEEDYLDEEGEPTEQAEIVLYDVLGRAIIVPEEMKILEVEWS